MEVYDQCNKEVGV